MKRQWLDTHVHVSAVNPDGSARETLATELMKVLNTEDAQISFVISLDGAELSKIASDPEGMMAGARLVRELTREAPGRLHGACMANPHFLDEALRCLDLCLGEWGFVMFGEVLQYMWDLKLDSPEVAACVRRAAEFDVPAQIHISTSNSKIHPSSDGTEQLEDLLRLVDRVPEAKYILAHLVGTDTVPPVVDGYLDQIDRRYGRWPDNFWCEIRDFNSPGVKSVLERVPHNRLIAGTDWTTRVGPPFAPYGTIFGHTAEDNPYPARISAMVEFLKLSGASDDVVEGIAWRNAAELLKLV
ncbi:MAG: amidohydrolase family protein [Bacteroidota bacterium]